MINEHDIRDMRYAVLDEDGEKIRVFDTKEEAQHFCLKNWSIIEIQGKLILNPFQKVGDAPF
jgi:hypothetical protein